MKIQLKIALSIAMLLLVITVLGGYSARTTEKLKENTENILAANYNAVKYAQKMLRAIHNLQVDSLSAVKLFEENLQLQKDNISESSELQTTFEIQRLFDAYLAKPD